MSNVIAFPGCKPVIDLAAQNGEWAEAWSLIAAACEDALTGTLSDEHPRRAELLKLLGDARCAAGEAAPERDVVRVRPERAAWRRVLRGFDVGLLVTGVPASERHSMRACRATVARLAGVTA